MRSKVGEPTTTGLDDSELSFFLERDNKLAQAIEDAHAALHGIEREFGSNYIARAELDLIKDLQSGFVNFYNPATVNPYVALSARGPWIVTSH